MEAVYLPAMDPRREQELLKQLPFGLDRSVSLADGLPIRFERIIGFTLLIAIYVLLTCLPFAVVFLVLASAGSQSQAAVWLILGKSFAALWFGSAGWMALWFVVYVALDLKHPSTLGRIPGLGVEDEDDEDDAAPAKQTAPKQSMR